MKFVSIVVGTAMIVSSSPALAQSRCPAGDMGCDSSNYERKIKDRIAQGKREVSEARGPTRKAKAAGRVIKDCTDCGMKVLTDQLSTATPE